MPLLRSRETIMENEMPSPAAGALLANGYFGQPKELDFLNTSTNTEKYRLKAGISYIAKRL